MCRTSRNSCSPATHTVCSEVFKDNQNVTKIESNNLLMRSTKQRKWYFAEAVTTQTVSQKKCSEILGKLTGKHFCRSHFLGCMPATLLKKILMNKRFSVNGYKHLWTTASDFGKYLTTLTIIFDSVDNIWNFGLWNNLVNVVRECFSEKFIFIFFKEWFFTHSVTWRVLCLG